MKYATVMVGMSLGQSNEARLEIAGQLAERFGARVIGVAAAEFSPPLYFTDGEQAQKLIDQGWAAVKNRRRHAIGANCVGRRRRRGHCRCLWPLKAQRMDSRGRNATAHQSNQPLRLAVALKLISINAAGRRPA